MNIRSSTSNAFHKGMNNNLYRKKPGDVNFMVELAYIKLTKDGELNVTVCPV